VRNYEVVFVAAPTLTSEELDGFIKHIQTVVASKNGKVVKVDNWGKKSLAYKIKRFREGYYVVLSIEGDGSAIAELERRFRVTDYIIRFIRCVSTKISSAPKRSKRQDKKRRRSRRRISRRVSTRKRRPSPICRVFIGDRIRKPGPPKQKG